MQGVVRALLDHLLEAEDGVGALDGHRGVGSERAEDLDVVLAERLPVEGAVAHDQHGADAAGAAQRRGHGVAGPGRERRYAGSDGRGDGDLRPR